MALIAVAVPALAAKTTVKEYLDKLVDVVSDVIGNGDVGVYEYDVKKLNIGKSINEIKETYEGCSKEIVVGRRENIERMKEDDYIDDSFQDWHKVDHPRTKFVAGVQKLYKAKKLKTIIGYTWDGDKGDSEYCSFSAYDIYTTDGYVLSVIFDFTD